MSADSRLGLILLVLSKGGGSVDKFSCRMYVSVIQTKFIVESTEIDNTHKNRSRNKHSEKKTTPAYFFIFIKKKSFQ